MDDDYSPDHEAPNSIRNVDQRFPALESESRNDTGRGGGGMSMRMRMSKEDEEEYKFDENYDEENEHERGRKLDVDGNYDDEEGQNVNERRPTTSEAAVPFQLRMARVLASKARASANESQAAVTYSKAINELARLQGQALKEKEEETQRLLRESMYDGFEVEERFYIFFFFKNFKHSFLIFIVVIIVVIIVVVVVFFFSSAISVSAALRAAALRSFGTDLCLKPVSSQSHESSSTYGLSLTSSWTVAIIFATSFRASRQVISENFFLSISVFALLAPLPMAVPKYLRTSPA